MKTLNLVYLLCILLWPGLAIAGFNESQAASGQTNQPGKSGSQTAKRGMVYALGDLGVMYELDQRAPLNSKEAVEWYREAAEQGDASAQLNYGLRHYEGQGVPQDFKLAAAMFRQAAKQGNTNAQAMLGILYDRGHGVPQSYRQAVEWYGKAAAQGNAYAQYYLGLLYVAGKGVPRDNVQAHMWLNLAASSGIMSATRARDALEQKMTARQKRVAQRLAREWSPRRPNGKP